MTKSLFPSITFTNIGYVDYTKNLIESININKVNLDLRVFCIDEKSIKKLENKATIETFDNKYLDTGDFVDWKDKNFGLMMLYKFEMIHRYLNNNEFVLYLDGDIVIKKDIEEYLIKSIKNKDIIFQDDTNPRYPNKQTLCAGFMFIRSNKKTIKFFNPNNLNIEKISNYAFHDQTYINKNKNKFNYGVLPLKVFSSGAYFYNNFNNYEPSMIHFNYVVGDEKKELMQKYNEWYV